MPKIFEIVSQDSTITKTNQIKVEPLPLSIGKLDIGRQTIELSSLDRLIDSTRLAPKPKKIIPIIKTVPYISECDSIPTPEYNTFTGEFELPNQTTEWDNFYFTPFDPKTKSAPKPIQQNKVNTDFSSSTLEPQKDVLVIDKTEQPKGFTKTDWMLGVLIFSFILFAWINVKFSRFINSVVSASYNYFAARKLQEEGNVVRSKVFIVMNFLFFINTALLITQWFDFNHIKLFGQSGYILFFIFLAAVILIYGFKSFCFVVLDYIFLTKGAFLDYNSTVFIYNKIFGFALLPLVSCIPFVSTKVAYILLVLAIIIFGILYIMRLLRGIMIGIKNRLSLLYLILYLCALEILPLLVLYHSIEKYL